ncbi:hypothetical protein [Pseudoxanthomonas daejeonensis]|uniref:Uncharacterized protein n=1 Tax=Pseudoxanthomonas daejeonensis TaxID=266062 RepID=A0ABQ6Z5M1_9GAMM|nr:hypothetical protein [Pseudoxanthomonas daejeonensis]KAF1693776.1 hypothetical protein CSC65_10855 [Pseudoxanthomonas daejeonensis]
MSTPDDLHDALLQLHEPPAPESLWPRLKTLRRRQVRRRRMAAALASTGLVAALFMVLPRPDMAPEHPAFAPLAATGPAIDDGVDPQVHAIDRALQVAYENGASDLELAPMWEARHALIAQRQASRSHAGDLNDI